MTCPVRLRYQTIEIGNNDIHLCTLRDNQQFNDDQGLALELGISSATWPIFGVIWPSSIVLAHHVLEFDTSGKRILEVGCGIALSSILLNKLHENISATDYHPEVKHFLDRNTRLNQDTDIDFERVDWANDDSQLGKFDLLIGSDLLYEDQHIALLAGFIENHAHDKCEVIIVDPGRGRANKLSTLMHTFGFISEHTKPVHTEYLKKHFKGQILKYARGT